MKPFNPEEFLVLVVDDVSHNLQVIADILEEVGYDTTFATSGEQALERVATAQPHLILLDLMMPEMNGFQVCSQLKSDSRLDEIPVIFLTASHEKHHLIEAFAKGAVDYISKPFNAPELLARVRTHLELKHTQEQLRQCMNELVNLTAIDSLTQIWNHRYIGERVQQEFNRACRYNRPFSLLMFDIDVFKHINNTHSYFVGNQVLKIIAKTVFNSLRKIDSLGRWEREEFLIILPEIDGRSAIDVAERLQKCISQTVIPVGEQSLQVTISIGVASYQSVDLTIDAILQRASQALDHAKKQGSNQAICQC
ncbi:diguanylate cyclase [Lyngbya aestuarii]|uniref:diguanylate cyclase n=1 Tax=Lyngbya aestuarii TaxID=118322 RepID=UPI00403E2F2B